jgi:hypothetical protein
VLLKAVARSEHEQGVGTIAKSFELVRLLRKSSAAFVKIHWRAPADRADAEWRTTEASTINVQRQSDPVE